MYNREFLKSCAVFLSRNVFRPLEAFKKISVSPDNLGISRNSQRSKGWW
jgi:hypothetical protein